MSTIVGIATNSNIYEKVRMVLNLPESTSLNDIKNAVVTSLTNDDSYAQQLAEALEVGYISTAKQRNYFDAQSVSIHKTMKFVKINSGRVAVSLNDYLPPPPPPRHPIDDNNNSNDNNNSDDDNMCSNNNVTLNDDSIDENNNIDTLNTSSYSTNDHIISTDNNINNVIDNVSAISLAIPSDNNNNK